MKSKKLAKLLSVMCMIGMLTMVLASCGGDKDKKDGKESIKGQKFIAATEPTFAPFDTTDEDGNIIGFDMDLMDAIAKDQGFKVEYKAFEFDALIPALQNGNADIITAGMNAEDPARQKKVDFSKTYYDSGLVVMVKADNNDIKSIKDLKDNMIVASQIGTTGADKANKLKKEGKIKETKILNQFTDCTFQVKNGDVDAVIIDKPVAEEAIGKDSSLKIVGKPLNAESYGFAVKKGNEALRKAINKGLEKLTEDGTYDKIYKKWFGKAPEKK